MSKSLFTVLLCAMLGITAKASSIITESSEAPSLQPISYSPQVCQFSLSSYSGTITGGNTQSFKVGLSCPQESDTRATVAVYINGDIIASKVVLIKAGKDQSETTSILVGNSYNGQHYRLIVE